MDTLDSNPISENNYGAPPINGTLWSSSSMPPQNILSMERDTIWKFRFCMWLMSSLMRSFLILKEQKVKPLLTEEEWRQLPKQMAMARRIPTEMKAYSFCKKITNSMMQLSLSFSVWTTMTK